MSSYLTKDSLKFLRELRDHNDRDWFAANKERYEAGLRDPALRLVADLGPSLRKLSRYFEVDPRPNGGSLSRIYRDTRFSKDKSPYKTAIFMHVTHEKGDEEAAPGFFLHLEPGGSTVGGGVWQPATGPLKKIRDAIAKSPAAWKKATTGRAAGSLCRMSGESLKRVPPGYDPDHPLAAELKRKEFGVSTEIADKVVVSDQLFAAIVSGLKDAAPLVEFLCKTIGLPF